MSEGNLTTQTVVVDGRPAFCRVMTPASGRSAGPPLILIHGLACASDVWAPALDAFARQSADRLAIAPDLPGCGHSDDPPEALGIDEMAGWIDLLLDRLGFGSAHLAAHSMGCEVAIAAADRCGDRVRSLVLVGPILGNRAVPPWRTIAGVAANVFFEPLLFNGLLVKMVSEAGICRAVSTSVATLLDHPLARAGGVCAPTLILRGEKDMIVPDSAARRLAAALPHSRFERIAGASHALQFNRPDHFAAITLDYLAEVEANTDRKRQAGTLAPHQR